MVDDPSHVQISKLRQNLAAFLQEAEHGQEFLVMSRGRPVALLGPPRPTGGVIFGVLKGKLDISPDFDDPLPDDILDQMENGSIEP